MNWGDSCGYVWGPQSKRVDVPIENVKKRQTYYGAVDVLSGQFFLRPYQVANSHHTVTFVRYLQRHRPDQQLLLFWDGAPYHRQKHMAKFLETVNNGLPPEQWQVICVPLAPYAPEENPVEDIWLKAKTFIRSQPHLCTTFARVKQLFVKAIRQERYFDFPKLNQYLYSYT